MNEKHSASGAELDAARLVLARMGLSPEDLVAHPQPKQVAPTFADYIPKVAQAVSAGTKRVYGSYWNRIIEHWGRRRLDEPTALEIKQLAEHVKTHVVARRNARGGRGAAEHLIAALRCVYNHAVADGWITDGDNPAKRVPKPRRLPTTRRGLPDSGLTEINHVAATTGNDPTLDALLIRLHTETACRRGGALALTARDLDPQQCLVLLHEKGGTARWQPVSPTLMRGLQEHAEHRGAAESGGQLLRYRHGEPITTRRYDHLWLRIGRHLPWVATQQISTHWLRHTTLTWVERHFGYAVARAYAGHTDTAGGDGTTTTYIRAGIDETAAALAALTGEPHPLARPTGREQ
ncbi:tyrosine-type recombinase/integrase [Saccharopolyspora sp. NFXS83]|uniref:tyrosine-type recombinase/integrase n=1 Tax=Saccharopolyspora sp. NFXS83 TaxID=2993560 RepID=UPI00224ADA0E|nr:site-specific integrase [Saccharopolyspora sp. NFXS83]MCX2729412.1 tyrosine-type recombinase/integrase [Saccharopolyspora sp. NFXS83]